MKRILGGLCLMAIYGCSSELPTTPDSSKDDQVTKSVASDVVTSTPIDVPADINGVTAKSLEGKKYQVFLGSAYLGVRDQLKDGEVLTLKDVVFEPSSYDQGYFKAHYLDSKGAPIFADYYSLSDVGLLDSRMMAIDTTVSDEKVNQGRGEVLHGKTPDQTGEYMTYMYLSTSMVIRLERIQSAYKKVKAKRNLLVMVCPFRVVRDRCLVLRHLQNHLLPSMKGLSLSLVFLTE